MGDVVQFVPRAEREASGNLADFIRLAKEGLTFEFCVARHRADANELQTSWLISGSRF